MKKKTCSDCGKSTINTVDGLCVRCFENRNPEAPLCITKGDSDEIMRSPLEILEACIESADAEMSIQEEVLERLKKKIEFLQHSRNQYINVIELMRREAGKK